MLGRSAGGLHRRQRPQEISKQRNAYLLRTVEYHLAPWNDLKDPEQAKALTYLFAGLADPHWPNGSIEVITTDQTRCSGATKQSKPGAKHPNQQRYGARSMSPNRAPAMCCNCCRIRSSTLDAAFAGVARQTCAAWIGHHKSVTGAPAVPGPSWQRHCGNARPTNGHSWGVGQDRGTRDRQGQHVLKSPLKLSRRNTASGR